MSSIDKSFDVIRTWTTFKRPKIDQCKECRSPNKRSGMSAKSCHWFYHPLSRFSRGTRIYLSNRSTIYLRKAMAGKRGKAVLVCSPKIFDQQSG